MRRCSRSLTLEKEGDGALAAIGGLGGGGEGEEKGEEGKRGDGGLPGRRLA